MSAQREKTFNLKSLSLLLISIWLSLALFALLSQVSSWLTSHHFEMSLFAHLRFFTLRIWLPWLVLMPIVLWLALLFPIKPKNWLKGLLLHAFFLLSLSFITGLLISLHYHFFEDMSPGMENFQP